MITLHLYGNLAEKFGKQVSLDARTPREAVTALSYQSPEYKEILRCNDWHIFVGKGNDITESELDMLLGSVTEVHLIPRIEGSSGAFNFIVGAILTVVGYFLSPFAIGVPLMAVGIGMMIGGIIQMVTKVPGVSDTSRESGDDKGSFLFNGTTNTSTQGVSMPRGYGRMLVGSVVVSAAIYSENLSTYSTPPPVLTNKANLWRKL
jgi:predicted phage tail protein